MRLIDAEKAVEFIRKQQTKSIARECAINAVNNTPVEDVAPVVRARWKDAVQGCHDSPHVICSACGEYYWQYFKTFRYCPNCGAKMDGGE